MESLVSDIPSLDGKSITCFYRAPVLPSRRPLLNSYISTLSLINPSISKHISPYPLPSLVPQLELYFCFSHLSLINPFCSCYYLTFSSAPLPTSPSSISSILACSHLAISLFSMMSRMACTTIGERVKIFIPSLFSH